MDCDARNRSRQLSFQKTVKLKDHQIGSFVMMITVVFSDLLAASQMIEGTNEIGEEFYL
jgi:hypothetical protein